MSITATYQKAEVLYQMGRFEEALVFYHMGGKQRPDMDIFHQGVRKAQEAIEISLGGAVYTPPLPADVEQLQRPPSSVRDPLFLSRLQ